MLLQCHLCCPPCKHRENVNQKQLSTHSQSQRLHRWCSVNTTSDHVFVSLHCPPDVALFTELLGNYVLPAPQRVSEMAFAYCRSQVGCCSAGGFGSWLVHACHDSLTAAVVQVFLSAVHHSCRRRLPAQHRTPSTKAQAAYHASLAACRTAALLSA